MQEYQYTNNGTEVVELIPVGPGCGMSIRECLDTAKQQGLTFDPALVPPSPCPAEIANWRARAVLEIAGLLPTVEAAIESLTGEAGIVARAAWNSGAPFVREGPTVVALSAALSLTSEQVDTMFIQAAALDV